MGPKEETPRSPAGIGMYWKRVRQFAHLESGNIWRCDHCGRKVREVNIMDHLEECYPPKGARYVYERKREEIDLVRW